MCNDNLLPLLLCSCQLNTPASIHTIKSFDRLGNGFIMFSRIRWLGPYLFPFLALFIPFLARWGFKSTSYIGIIFFAYLLNMHLGSLPVEIFSEIIQYLDDLIDESTIHAFSLCWPLSVNAGYSMQLLWIYRVKKHMPR